MLKVLFVDDEPLIREGLCSIIDWKSYGYRIVGTAKNGREGLELIRQQNPDLVFVDIKMPGISGINMVARAKAFGNTAKYVVLSGYSDFTFAQESIRLGVESYLLKPVDENELIPLIQKIKEKCIEERKLDSQLLHYEKMVEKQEWKDLLVGKLDTLSQRLLFTYENDTFHLANIIASKPIDWENIQNKLLSMEDYQTKILQMEQSICILFINYDRSTIKSYLEKARMKIKSIARDTKIQLVEKTFSLLDLSTGYQSLRHLEDFRFSYDDTIIFTDRIIHSRENRPKAAQNWDDKISQVLEFENFLKLDHLLDEIKEYYQQHVVKKENILVELIELVKNVYNRLSKTNPDVKEIKLDEWMEQIYQSPNLIMLLDCLKQRFIQLSTKVNGFVGNIDDPVKKIIQYIEQYYDKELNLKLMAELFKYNPSYLGKKFKNYTGDYFHIYLDKVRMQKAQQLLEERKLKVYEVSEMVGYHNIDYFYKKFKKYIGISPKEFQKRAIELQERHE
ncbi:response regulator [Gracilibacillus dipsosauri]|uniref:response regulator n=1 Tax=Gracilibacillus dipsosauri TaxID=178340 RepID=UPI00240A9AD6